MIRSIRLDPLTEKRLARAAQAVGMSRSEFIRDAVHRRCDVILGNSLADRSSLHNTAAQETTESHTMILTDAGPLVALIDRG